MAFVGLLEGYPYEIFTGLQDDEEGIALPKSVTKGKIIKQTAEDGTHRYDFSLKTSVVIRPLSRAYQRSLIQSIGTMRS